MLLNQVVDLIQGQKGEFWCKKAVGPSLLLSVTVRLLVGSVSGMQREYDIGVAHGHQPVHRG